MLIDARRRSICHALHSLADRSSIHHPNVFSTHRRPSTMDLLSNCDFKNAFVSIIVNKEHYEAAWINSWHFVVCRPKMRQMFISISTLASRFDVVSQLTCSLAFTCLHECLRYIKMNVTSCLISLICSAYINFTNRLLHYTKAHTASCFQSILPLFIQWRQTTRRTVASSSHSRVKRNGRPNAFKRHAKRLHTYVSSKNCWYDAFYICRNLISTITNIMISLCLIPRSCIIQLMTNASRLNQHSQSMQRAQVCGRGRSDFSPKHQKSSASRKATVIRFSISTRQSMFKIVFSSTSTSCKPFELLVSFLQSIDYVYRRAADLVIPTDDVYFGNIIEHKNFVCHHLIDHRSKKEDWYGDYSYMQEFYGHELNAKVKQDYSIYTDFEHDRHEMSILFPLLWTTQSLLIVFVRLT